MNRRTADRALAIIKIAEIHFLVVILVAGAIGALIGFGLNMVAAR